MDLKDFVNKMIEVYDIELIAFVVYGSSVLKAEYSEKFSDINTIIVLKDLSPLRIQASNKYIKKWVRNGNPIPLFFDMDHIKSSVDVFPIEFSDIKERHKVIFGKEDIFSGINVDLKNLRHQCESELKGTILRLNSFYSANCDDPKLIANFVLKTWPGIRTTFGAILKLLGFKPSNEPKALIELLASKIEFNPQVYFDVLAIREGSMLAPRRTEALEFFEQYLTELKTITNFVDKFNTEVI